MKGKDKSKPCILFFSLILRGIFELWAQRKGGVEKAFVLHRLLFPLFWLNWLIDSIYRCRRQRTRKQEMTVCCMGLLSYCISLIFFIHFMHLMGTLLERIKGSYSYLRWEFLPRNQTTWRASSVTGKDASTIRIELFVLVSFCWLRLWRWSAWRLSFSITGPLYGTSSQQL